MSEKINCPFCGNIIEQEAYRCPSCNSLFTEPELVGLRFKEFAPFLALEVLTFGLFGTLWFFINAKPLTRMATAVLDKRKFNWLVILLLLNIIAYVVFICKYSMIHVASIMVLAQIVINVLLTYRVIRIIQKYTKQTYDVMIEFNPYYIAIFNILYLIHFIDTYSARVMQIHEYFNWKSPQMILLIFILLIIQFIACLNTNIHHFYKWLFGF